ncbi:MAG: hypothetical protein RRY97_01245, partial [Oscillibacter sp.]
VFGFSSTGVLGFFACVFGFSATGCTPFFVPSARFKAAAQSVKRRFPWLRWRFNLPGGLFRFPVNRLFRFFALGFSPRLSLYPLKGV